jgi:glyoxylase-like metal-dependent hydrolase (beta-lactamase superfamily II)
VPTAAEPQRGSLPITGGRDDAKVRLWPLLSATAKGPPAWFHRQTGRLAAPRALGIGVPRDQWVEFPVVAFLVEHPGFGHLLIDTGFHSSVAVDPKQNLGRVSALAFKDIKMEPSQAVSHQLRARGIEPGGIKLVVMTHLHVDHASAISEFPAATFLINRREWQAATEPRGSLRGYVQRQFDHAFDFRMLDFHSRESESFASFGRSLDVFGDGSVRLVSTPGHTAGHMSVVLRLAGREALIAGDAIYTMRTLTDSALPHQMDDEHVFRRSLRELQLYAEQTPGALIVPGHDMSAWNALAPVY